MSTVAEKLGIAPGSKVLALAAPKDALEVLADLPKGAQVSTSGRGPFKVILAFPIERRDVEGLFRTARVALDPDGALWMAYPKKGGTVRTDLSRDYGWDVLEARGWSVTNEVTLNDTWSVLRFTHDPAAQTKRAQHAAGRAAEKPTVSLRRGDVPARARRREAETVSLRGPGLDEGGDETSKDSGSDD